MCSKYHWIHISSHLPQGGVRVIKEILGGENSLSPSREKEMENVSGINIPNQILLFLCLKFKRIKYKIHASQFLVLLSLWQRGIDACGELGFLEIRGRPQKSNYFRAKIPLRLLMKLRQFHSHQIEKTREFLSPRTVIPSGIIFLGISGHSIAKNYQKPSAT